jgi:hypothetical protein
MSSYSQSMTRVDPELDVCQHPAGVLRRELRFIDTLYNLSMRSWSPTLKAHTEEIVACKQLLEQELINRQLPARAAGRLGRKSRIKSGTAA